MGYAGVETLPMRSIRVHDERLNPTPRHEVLIPRVRSGIHSGRVSLPGSGTTLKKPQGAEAGSTPFEGSAGVEALPRQAFVCMGNFTPLLFSQYSVAAQERAELTVDAYPSWGWHHMKEATRRRAR